MLPYLLGRVLQAILSMLVVISIVFVLARLSGNPVHLLLDVNATQQDADILMAVASWRPPGGLIVSRSGDAPHCAAGQPARRLAAGSPRSQAATALEHRPEC
jgi:hypothetical protein